MKPLHWLIAIVIMGIIIALWGSAAFACLIIATWSSGGICYLMGLYFKQCFEETARKRPGRYGVSYKRARMNYFERQAEVFAQRANILMWLGCIAIIEAFILAL